MAFARPPPSIIAQRRPELEAFIGRVVRIRFPADAALASWWRSLARNASVGGAPDSQHLIGTALDLTTRSLPLLLDEARRVGLVAIDEGTHAHLQLFPAGSSPVRRTRLI